MTGNSIVLVNDSGGSTGTVEMHPIFAQWSGSGLSEWGQHGCADATGIEAIAAQVRDANKETNTSKTTRILPGSFAVEFAVLSIAD
jgi:hypothetical protein